MSEKTKHPISVHSFILPIRWDYLHPLYQPDTRKENISFDERTDLSKITEKLYSSAWKRTFYRIDNNPLQYNELTYFHAYATKTLFDLQQKDETGEEVISNNKTMAYFEIGTSLGDYYLLRTVDGNYELNLTGLSLHVYNTGVAILSFTLENYQYQKSEDILRINEFGRRIYPQFLGTRVPFTEATKNSFQASLIEVKCNNINNGIPIQEDFSQYDTLQFKETHLNDSAGEYQYNTVIDFPNHIKALFTNDFVFNANDEKGGDKIRFNLLTDDRMFFQCWYGDNNITQSLKQESELISGKKGFAYANSDFWHAFMFGDKSAGNLGIANSFLKEETLLKNTYDRWVGYGTLYGFTRDSFVAISEALKDLPIDLKEHFKTIYYQMAVLCLAQRAITLRFSAEVSSLADLGKTDGKKASLLINQLYLNYIEFINKIYFREVTPQIQGIDIYSQFQEAMNIEKDIIDLDREIQELHNYATLIEQKEATDEAVKLNRLATVFLPATFTVGLLALLSDKVLDYTKPFDWFFALFILAYLIIALTVLRYSKIINRGIQSIIFKENKR